MIRVAHTVIFVGALWCCAGLAQVKNTARIQPQETYMQSQETINALSSQRITQLEAVTTANKVSITELTAQLSQLNASIDRFTGIGIGIGTTLTMLQAILLIVTFRNGKRP